MSIVGSVPRVPRFALRVPVRVRPVGAVGWQDGHTINISRSGLLLELRSSLCCDDEIEAIVQLSDATVSVADVVLRGRVIRVAPAGSLTQLATTIDEYKFYAPHPSVAQVSISARR